MSQVHVYRAVKVPGYKPGSLITSHHHSAPLFFVVVVHCTRMIMTFCNCVSSELASTLKMFDISLTEDMDMVAQIKKEVKKLCTRNIIAAQITVNERDQDKQENLARMIYESEQDMKVYLIVNYAQKQNHPLSLIDFTCFR